MTYRCTRLLVSSNAFWGSVLMSTLQDGYVSAPHGWSSQWCANPVMGTQLGMFCTPLHHFQWKKTWLHQLPGMTVEASVWAAGESVPWRTADCVCLDMHSQFPVSQCSYNIRRNGRKWCEHKKPMKVPFEISNKWCQAVCMIYAPGFLQETSLP